MTVREGVGSRVERERGERESMQERKEVRENVGEIKCDGATHTSSKHVLHKLTCGY